MTPSQAIYLMMFLLTLSFTGIGQETKKDSSPGLKYYHEDVVGISKDGLVRGLDAIKAYWDDFYQDQGAIVNHQTLYSIPVLERLEYTIESFETKNGASFVNLLIWLKTNGDRSKVLDAVYQKADGPVDSKGITKAREKWMELCNQHNAGQLVRSLYTEDAIYYNRGRVLRGHDQISSEYSYMNNPSYSLELNPQILERVTDEIAYEIGQCSGSYSLPYMLIWKKQSNGNWKIYFDSNY